MQSLLKLLRIAIITIVSLFVLSIAVSAQPPGHQPDLELTAALRTAIINNLERELNDRYVFPETSKQMTATLQQKLTANEYDAITSSKAFAERLTSDLRAISHDKHLGVRFSFNELPVRKGMVEPTAEESARAELSMKRRNYGVNRAEWMDGNIGYIELREFMDAESGADAVAAAMSLVANTDALIFDLRRNGGGSPEMVALICSYLFGDKPVHLNDIYFRPENRTDEFWTKPTVAGKKYLGKDVYVLTSSRTFSAAEEFTNNLKMLKRGTIVGETTGGGANPGRGVRLNEHFSAFIPTGRAINPITKTNWEGTGVEPDVKVPKEQALKTAYLMALKKSIAGEKNEDLKRQLQELIDKTQKELAETNVGKGEK